MRIKKEGELSAGAPMMNCLKPLLTAGVQATPMVVMDMAIAVLEFRS